MMPKPLTSRALAAPILALGLLASTVLPLVLSESARPRLPSSMPGTGGVEVARASSLGLPLAFESIGDGGYVAGGRGFAVRLTDEEALLQVEGSELRMRPVGASEAMNLTAAGPTGERRSYLTGADPSSWRRGVSSFGRVEYRSVWAGVDLAFHGNEHNQLEHDFVVHPGADPQVVAVDFPGSRAVALDRAGDLLVETGPEGTAPVRFSRPTVYQEIEGERREVAGSFSLLGDTRVGYSIGHYDTSRPLVIDPVLVTSTYLGGGGADSVAAVAVDSSGAVYIAGSTDSADFQTLKPVQDRLNLNAPEGPSDAFVAKLEPSGDKLAWATFLGGGSNDAALDIAVGGDGSVVVTGVTESPDFPLRGEAPGRGEYGGGPSDAFVARIDPTGSTLAYSMFLGGAELDSGRAVALDSNGAAYLTGSTSSGDFPSVNPVRGARRSDDADAFVTKVNVTGSTLVYSTRIGGGSDDHGLDLAITPEGAAVVTGDTRSSDFPTAKPLQAGIGGGETAGDANASDAFLFRLDPAGSALELSTFLGGADSDQGTGVALDGQGSMFVTGNTSSTDFPTATPQQPAFGGDTDAFLTKLDAGAVGLTWSTYLGGTGADGGNAVVVDGEGRATVAGVASSTNFPTVQPLQPANGGGASDGFVTTYNGDGAALLASTYLGGDDEDQLAAVALSGSDAVAVGSSASANVPTVRPLQPARAPGSSDGLITRVSLAAAPPAPAAPAQRPSTGSGTSSHDRRVQVLVVLTAVLFLLAVGQTAYLRRRDAAGVFAGARGGSALPQDDDDDRWSSVPVLPPVSSAGGTTDDWSVPERSRPSAEVAEPVDEEESFWDLFPAELPPHGRVPGDDEWWAGDLPSDDLLKRQRSAPPGPLNPPPKRARGSSTGPESSEADVLLTELLAGDLSPVEAAASDDSGGRTDTGDIQEDIHDDGGGHDDDDGHDGDGADGGADHTQDAATARRSSSGGKGGSRRRSRNRRSGRRKRPSGG